MDPATCFLSLEDTKTTGTLMCGTASTWRAPNKKSDGALRLTAHSSTYSFLRRVIVACLAVLLWGTGVEAQDEIATLLNLSPWQSYVHLFCDKTGGADCAVTFRCGQQTGDPVTWNVEVEPSRIFTYWPNKTDGSGRAADLEAALVDAGLTSTEARRRTTCTVRSDDPVEARAYTFLAGQLVPVANVNTGVSGGPRQPGSTDVALSDLIVSTERIRYGVSDTTSHVTLVPPFDSNTTSYVAATVSHDVDKVYITAVGAESEGISGIIQINGSSTTSGASSEAITLTAGRTTTISIVVSAADGLTRKVYTVTVTRQEETRTPPPRSGGGEIIFIITDACDDGYIKRYGFFEYSRTSLTNSRTSLVNSRKFFMNGGFGTTERQRISCTVGNRVCIGAESSEQWGVGYGHHYSCSDCCWTCPRIRPGPFEFRSPVVRRRLTCPDR